MSLSKKLIISTLVVLALVSMGGMGVLYLTWQRETMAADLAHTLGSTYAGTFDRMFVLGLTIAGLAFGSGVVVFLFMVWNSWISIVRVAMPLGKFSDMLERLSEGKDAIKSPDEISYLTRRQDEIGAIARAIVDLCASRKKLKEDEARQRQEAKEKEQHAAALENLVREFVVGMTAVMRELDHAGQNLQSAAGVMDGASRQTQDMVVSLTDEFEMVDRSMQTVASARATFIIYRRDP